MLTPATSAIRLVVTAEMPSRFSTSATASRMISIVCRARSCWGRRRFCGLRFGFTLDRCISELFYEENFQSSCFSIAWRARECEFAGLCCDDNLFLTYMSNHSNNTSGPQGKTYLITGATGTVGSLVVENLLARDAK